jgi:hypothetical protein
MLKSAIIWRKLTPTLVIAMASGVCSVHQYL